MYKVNVTLVIKEKIGISELCVTRHYLLLPQACALIVHVCICLHCVHMERRDWLGLTTAKISCGVSRRDLCKDRASLLRTQPEVSPDRTGAVLGHIHSSGWLISPGHRCSFPPLMPFLS